MNSLYISNRCVISCEMKKFFVRFIFSAALLICLMSAAPAAVSAASYPTKYQGRSLSKVYSYTYYTRKYPSAVRAVGDDPEKVLEYFVKYGMPRGHQAISTFNVKEYFSSHKDLRQILGKGYRNYYYYYQLYGRFGDGSPEARKGIRVFSTIVCLDPGHQTHMISAQEPIGPGSSVYKTKVSSGTYGRWSRLNEYEVVLQVGQKLRKELVLRGYTVVMTRTKNDVSMSNAERARFANSKDADLMIRLHCDGEDYGSSLHGARGMAAARGNPWLSASVVSEGQRLANLLSKYQALSTGQPQLETLYTNEMTGINWAKMPCAIIEMGYMSNYAEDLNLARSAYQDKIARGLAEAVDHFVND